MSTAVRLTFPDRIPTGFENPSGGCSSQEQVTGVSVWVVAPGALRHPPPHLTTHTALQAGEGVTTRVRAADTDRRGGHGRGGVGEKGYSHGLGRRRATSSSWRHSVARSHSTRRITRSLQMSTCRCGHDPCRPRVSSMG
jgi:hypothetical protein